MMKVEAYYSDCFSIFQETVVSVVDTIVCFDGEKITDNTGNKNSLVQPLTNHFTA
jgi:hypothetical protein